MLQVNAQLLARAAANHGDSGVLQLDLDDIGRPGFPKVSPRIGEALRTNQCRCDSAQRFNPLFAQRAMSLVLYRRSSVLLLPQCGSIGDS